MPEAGSLIDQARKAGIVKLACCGTSEDDWEDVASLADGFTGIIPSFGLHPWYVQSRSDSWLEKLEQLLAENPSAGIGEAGLDHGIKERNDSEQAGIFAQQLELAKKLNRPISIHCRQAWGSMMPILTNLGPFPAGFVIHSYSGPKEFLEGISSLNGYVSFSGTITRSGNRRGHINATSISLDRILIETDAPDMPPVMRDKPDAGQADRPNIPANLVYTLKAISELRSISIDELAEATYSNACKLFGIRE